MNPSDMLDFVRRELYAGEVKYMAPPPPGQSGYAMYNEIKGQPPPPAIQSGYALKVEGERNRKYDGRKYTDIIADLEEQLKEVTAQADRLQDRVIFQDDEIGHLRCRSEIDPRDINAYQKMESHLGMIERAIGSIQFNEIIAEAMEPVPAQRVPGPFGATNYKRSK